MLARSRAPSSLFDAFVDFRVNPTLKDQLKSEHSHDSREQRTAKRTFGRCRRVYRFTQCRLECESKFSKIGLDMQRRKERCTATLGELGRIGEHAEALDAQKNTQAGV